MLLEPGRDVLPVEQDGAVEGRRIKRPHDEQPGAVRSLAVWKRVPMAAEVDVLVVRVGVGDGLAGQVVLLTDVSAGGE